jgi:hypothetical protein
LADDTLTPEQKAEDLALNVEARFGTLGNFYSWLDAALLTMQRNQLEIAISKLKEQQQDSRQQIEVGIQAKQVEYDGEIKSLRDTQQADFDKWQSQIDARQADLDVLVKQLQG